MTARKATEMQSPLPAWQATCYTHAGRMGRLSSMNGMVITIILLFMIPLLAWSVLTCLPKRTSRISPFTLPRPKNLAPRKATTPPGLKCRFLIATILLSLDVVGLIFLCLAIQVWNFCGPTRMGREIYIFIWVLAALLPGTLTLSACIAWGYIAFLLCQPKSPARIRAGNRPSQPIPSAQQPRSNTPASDWERAETWLNQ